MDNLHTLHITLNQTYFFHGTKGAEKYIDLVLAILHPLKNVRVKRNGDFEVLIK